MNYHGYTHFVHPALLPLWKLICCRLGWHAWDEVAQCEASGFDNYLVCDACEAVIGIFDAEIDADDELTPEQTEEAETIAALWRHANE